MANKFKVGDRVRIAHRKPHNSTGVYKDDKQNVGEIGFVVELWSDSYNVWGNMEKKVPYYGIFDAEELEPAPKYEIGTRVSVKENNSADSAKYDGQSGVITRYEWGCWTQQKYIDSCGLYSYYINLDNGDEACVWEKDIKPVNPLNEINKSYEEIVNDWCGNSATTWTTTCSHPDQGYIFVNSDTLKMGVDFGINKPKKTLMKTVSNFMKKFLDPGAQSLVKAGFINGDLELTLEGKEALFSVLFDANKEALVKLAKDKIKEEEEK